MDIGSLTNRIPTKNQITAKLAAFSGSDTALVLGTANALSGGGLASLVFNNPVGRAVLDAGYKAAALGGELVKGIFVYQRYDVRTQSYVDSAFKFPMNPESLEESLQPDWSETKVPGQNRPIYTFVHGGAREISFTLHFFYDRADRQHIAQEIDKLRALVMRPYDPKAKTGAGGPPPLYFYFGEYIKGERFIVKSLKIKAFDLFDPLLLLPLRAEVEITLAEAQSTLAPVQEYALKTTMTSYAVAQLGNNTLSTVLNRVGRPF